MEQLTTATPQTKQDPPPHHPKSLAEIALWTAVRAALLAIVSAIEIYLEWKSHKNKKTN